MSSSTQSGFYDYVPGEGRDPEVVYLIAPGELASAPGSVRDLPIVESFARSGGLEAAATIVFGPEAAITIPPERLGAGASRKTKVRARPSTKDAWGCEEVSFCLYDQAGFSGAFLTLQGFGTGWFDLWPYGFDNRAWSMRNRRNNDSLLASGSFGGGAGYCADSHSSDSSFNDNPLGVNSASSAALVPDDIHC